MKSKMGKQEDEIKNKTVRKEKKKVCMDRWMTVLIRGG